MARSFRLADLPYLRAFAGVSAGELARKLKVGVRDVERWEASEVIPQGAKMRRLRHWIASQTALMEDPEAWLREAKQGKR
jgi:DNA-binding transcriptional regulator YiaG